MMSLKLVICQWEVENASCQRHLLTGEQQTGEEKKQKKHYLHRHNEQWLLDIKDSTCHPQPPNSISHTDQLYRWQPRAHLKSLMTFQPRIPQNGCDYFVPFCVCVRACLCVCARASVSNLFAHTSLWSKCLIIVLFEPRLQPLCQHQRWDERRMAQRKLILILLLILIVIHQRCTSVSLHPPSERRWQWEDEEWGGGWGCDGGGGV